MSLLNDMLRDLSHQQKPTDALSGAAPTLELSAQEQRELFNQSSAAKPLPRSVMPSVMVFVVVLAVAMFWKWNNNVNIQSSSAQSSKVDNTVAQQIEASTIEQQNPEPSETSAIEQQAELIAIDVPVADMVESDSELAARLAALETAVTTLTSAVVDNKTISETPVASANSEVEGIAEVTYQEVSESVSVQDPFGNEENQTEVAVEKVSADELEPKSQVVQALSDEPAHLEIAPNAKWQDEEKARQARELIAQGQVGVAVEQLQQFVAKAKQPRESVKTLLDILIEQNDLAETQKIVNQADFLSPQERVFYQAKILVSQQLDEQAIELLEMNLVDADNDENYRALLAGLYQKNGQSVEAANHYRRLLSVFGDKPAYWLGFALSQDALNQPQVALQAYQRVNQYADLPPQVRTYIQQRLAALQ